MNFFKKKESEAIETTPEKHRENDGRDSVNIGTGFALDSSVRSTTAQAKIKYTRPEYNPQSRKAYYDNPEAHKAAIDRAFSSGDTVRDPYTGAELVKKQSDAKLKFGKDWQRHAAEADHIDPLSQIAKRTEKNPFLTTEDVREIGNADDNFQVMSRELNQTNKSVGKGGNTQQEWANDPTRMRGVAERSQTGETKEATSNRIREIGNAAQKRNDKRAFTKGVKNAVSTAHEAGKAGAQNAGVTTATMSSIMNITAVIKGEKSAEEALADTAVNTGKAALTGYVTGGGLTTLYQALSGSSSKFVQALTASNVPGKIITTVIITGDTLKRYGNGTISTQECLIELGEKGLNVATTGYSMAVGQALIPIPIVGAAVGALVGSMLTSELYHSLINQLNMKQLEHEERKRIINECEMVKMQAQRFRAELENYLYNYFYEYRNCFDGALSQIQYALQSGDADGIIGGANQITRKLGGAVAFDTVDEFASFLNSDTIDRF